MSMTTRSVQWLYGPPLVGIAGSKSGRECGYLSVYLECFCFQVESLLWDDHSSRRVLLSVVYLSVISVPQNEEAQVHRSTRAVKP